MYVLLYIELGGVGERCQEMDKTTGEFLRKIKLLETELSKLYVYMYTVYVTNYICLLIYHKGIVWTITWKNADILKTNCEMLKGFMDSVQAVDEHCIRKCVTYAIRLLSPLRNTLCRTCVGSPQRGHGRSVSIFAAIH